MWYPHGPSAFRVQRCPMARVGQPEREFSDEAVYALQAGCAHMNRAIAILAVLAVPAALFFLLAPRSSPRAHGSVHSETAPTVLLQASAPQDFAVP
jgi:hypothetical protein